MKVDKLLIVMGCLLALAIIGNVFQYCQEPKIVSVKEKIDTTKIKQQFKAELETKLRAELKPIIKIKKVVEKINLDSLRKVIDQYWINKIQAMNPDVPVKPNVLGDYNYNVDAPIVITDPASKKDTLLSATLQHTSRIPIDPESKYTISGYVFGKKITHTIETTITEQKTLWQKLIGSLNYSIQVGFGQGLINKQFDFYYGIGISFDIKSVF